ncbi:MAG TPA: NmrA/HSCARG family protein [Kofleriaceae bacterium]|jgi:uncharacterized protein YbjT (DUF2867 family)
MSKPTKILVVGATGKQGGAVINALLAKGFQAKALTRKPDSPAAKALAGRGVELATGDLTDRASVDGALRGTQAVFAAITPYEAGVDAETQQGILVADAAKAAGAFLLYSSVANADKNTGIPHFDSKFVVEKHITQLGVPHTILAPTAFYDNAYFGVAQLKQGIYANALPANRKLAQIAVSDIAAAAAAVFENVEKYTNKRYDISGEELTGEEETALLSEAIGKPLTYAQTPIEVIRQYMGDDGVAMYEWFERTGYSVDRALLARDFPTVKWQSFAQWARSVDWKALLG